MSFLICNLVLVCIVSYGGVRFQVMTVSRGGSEVVGGDGGDVLEMETMLFIVMVFIINSIFTSAGEHFLGIGAGPRLAGGQCCESGLPQECF